MKKPIKIALIALCSVFALLLIALGSLIVYAKYLVGSNDETVSYYAEDLDIGKDDFLNEFEEIYGITLDNYSLYEIKGLNMDSIHNAYSQRIAMPDIDDIEFGNILREYFSALNAGHASVYLRDHTAGYSPAFIENRVFLDNPNEYLRRSGFRDKDEIIAVNGKSVSEWLDKHEKFTPASTDEARKLMTARGIFRSWEDTAATYQVVRGMDTLEIDLQLKKYDLLPEMSESDNRVEWKILNDSVGYINIISMMDPVTDEFAVAYRNVKELPHLIVDIRNNGGGNSGNGRDIAEYLIRKQQPHCIAPSELMEPRSDAFNGKLYLLISTYTFSAAESFALDIKESGNATIVGTSTAGDTGNGPKTFNTTRGIYFRLPTRESAKSPKGFPLEGTGISPDYEVSQTVSDFLNSHDTVLDFTLRLIENNH